MVHKYCSSLIIDEIQFPQCFDYNQNWIIKQQKQPHNNNRAKQLLLQASSYLNIAQQGFNYVDSTIKEMTDIFEITVENLKPKEEKKFFSAAAKKLVKKAKKRKREDSTSSVVESSK